MPSNAHRLNGVHYLLSMELNQEVTFSLAAPFDVGIEQAESVAHFFDVIRLGEFHVQQVNSHLARPHACPLAQYDLVTVAPNLQQRKHDHELTRPKCPHGQIVQIGKVALNHNT